MMPGAARPAAAASRSSIARIARTLPRTASRETRATVGRLIPPPPCAPSPSVPSVFSFPKTGREVLEAGVLLEECDAHGADRAVALLADDQLRGALGFLRTFAVHQVHLVAVDENHDVGVLFERARFAQVGQLRPMVA